MSEQAGQLIAKVVARLEVPMHGLGPLRIAAGFRTGRPRVLFGRRSAVSGLYGTGAVANIHAAHNVCLSMRNHKELQKAAHEGQLTHKDARKLKTEELLQDSVCESIGNPFSSRPGRIFVASATCCRRLRRHLPSDPIIAQQSTKPKCHESPAEKGHGYGGFESRCYSNTDIV